MELKFSVFTLCNPAAANQETTEQLSRVLNDEDYCILNTDATLEQLLSIAMFSDTFIIKNEPLDTQTAAVMLHSDVESMQQPDMRQFYLSKKHLKINQHFYKITKLLKGNVVKDGRKFQKLTYVAEGCLIKICYKDSGFYQDTKIDYSVTKKLMESYDYLAVQEVIDYQLETEYVILAKKLIPGKDLQKSLSSYTYQQRLQILQQTLNQLADFERSGYQHNDIKSDNVMVTEELKAYVIDLGSLVEADSKIKRYDKDYFLRLFTMLHRMFMQQDGKRIPENKVLSYFEKRYLLDVHNYQPFIQPFIRSMLQVYNSDSTQRFIDISVKFSEFMNTINPEELPTEVARKKKHYPDLRPYLQKFMQYFPDIKHMLELNCGKLQETLASYDFLQQYPELSYCGADTDQLVVEANQQYYYHDRRYTFIRLHPLQDPVPRTDLLVAFRVLQSTQTLEEQWRVLANLRDSGAHYLLTEYAINTSGTVLALNLSQDPFRLPAPVLIFPMEDELQQGYQVAVYDLYQAAAYCDPTSATIQQLRQQLLPIMSREYAIVKRRFLQYPKGKELLRESLASGTNLDWQKYYYNAPYNEIVDSDEEGMRDAYISLMLLKAERDLKRLHSDHGEELNFITKQNFNLVSRIARDYLDLSMSYLDIF